MKIGSYEIKHQYDDNLTLPTISDEIYGANILHVAAGTNGLCGGDSGHGSRSFFEIADQGGTDISVWVNGKEIDDIEHVTITVGGDSELHTLIRALEFGAKALRALLRSTTLRNLALETDLEMTPEAFAQLIETATALDDKD